MKDDISIQLGEKSSQFKRILKIASSLISDTKLIFTEDKIRILDSDPAMVALVDLEISKEWFDTENSAYSYNREEEKTEVGVNLEKIEDALKGSTKDEQVKINYGETRSGQRTWKSLVQSQHKDEPDHRISVSRLSDELRIEEVFPEKEIEIKHPGKDLDYANKLQLNAESLKTVINEANRIADSIELNVNEQSVDFSIEGDFSNIEASIREEGFNVKEFVDESSTKASIDYLSKMFGKRLDAVSEEIILHQATGEEANGDFPLMFKANSENIEAEIILAPRIEEEE